MGRGQGIGYATLFAAGSITVARCAADGHVEIVNATGPLAEIVPAVSPSPTPAPTAWEPVQIPLPSTVTLPAPLTPKPLAPVVLPGALAPLATTTEAVLTTTAAGSVTEAAH